MSLGYRHAASIHRFRDPRGSIELWTVNGMVCARAAGHLTAASMDAYLTRQSDVLEQMGRRVLAFRDYGEVRGFEPQVKALTTRWTLRHRDRFEAIHVFARSTHVVLAAQSLSFASGDRLHVYEDPDDLQRAYVQALRNNRSTDEFAPLG
ncbi:MAG: hypothetical protein AAF654_06545 [Myxococcota bacterium]